MAGFSSKSLPSKTHHPKKKRCPETLRASGPFLILALTFPVRSVSSFLPQLPKTEVLQEVLGCLLPVPQHVHTWGEPGVPCAGPQLPCGCLQHIPLLPSYVCFIPAL